MLPAPPKGVTVFSALLLAALLAVGVLLTDEFIRAPSLVPVKRLLLPVAVLGMVFAGARYDVAGRVAGAGQAAAVRVRGVRV
jgi:hypothetical protein